MFIPDKRPESSSSGMRLWCAGLPEVGQRPLSDDERREYRRESAWLAVLSVLSFLFTPVALFMMLAGMAVVAEKSPAIGITFVVFAIGVLVLVGLLVIKAREWSSRAKGLRGDLKMGFVRRFEGILDRPNPHDPTEKALIQLGLLRTGSLQSLEVLPRSRRVIAVNTSRTIPGSARRGQRWRTRGLPPPPDSGSRPGSCLLRAQSCTVNGSSPSASGRSCGGASALPGCVRSASPYR